MESYQNNRLVRKYFNCTKCREYDTKLVNPFANHIYCSKCGSLLSEIPEIKYKKLKQKNNQNIFDRNEEDNKIPYKIKDNNYNKKYFKEKKEDKKFKKEKKPNKEKKYNNRHQSTSHYSDINMNFYNDDNDNIYNNINNNINNNHNRINNINNNYNRNNNYNNINRINFNEDNGDNNFFNNHNNYNNLNNNRNFNNYNNNNYNHNYNNSNNNRNYNNNHNFNNYNNINDESQEQRHRHNRRGHSMSNPPLYQNRNNNHNNNNNSNNFFADFFADDDFNPFNDTFFSNNSPFRITIHRQPISHDIFDPMFSSFGSFFNGFFQDNFSSNFRSNIAGDFFSQILSILERNQAEANKNKHPPASETALKKLKKFNMNEKYCKKDNKGKIELPNCCICLTEIQKGEKTVLLPCGHMFHWKCCLTWLKKNNTCPMCRFEIK